MARKRANLTPRKAYPVAAAAYPQGDPRSCLTHVVGDVTPMTPKGLPLCRRVKLESLLLDEALATPAEQATCERCRKLYADSLTGADMLRIARERARAAGFTGKGFRKT